MALAAGLRSASRGKQATLDTIEHLGYVQIDTISVIERAHHHVLWSRQRGYRADYLDQLLGEDRAVFEHWAHAVAYLPMRDYRFYINSFEARRSAPTSTWGKERYATAKPLFKEVLKRIKEEGPLSSRDFEDLSERGKSGWWDWKPAKVALEYLYLQGYLMVSSRQNFQRRYDLTERVLPADLDLRGPSAGERAAHQISRAMQSMGLAREKEIVKYLEIGSRADIGRALKRMVADGDLVKLGVKGIPGETYYTAPSTLEAGGGSPTPGTARILSPFDNVTIQRERMRLLFDFDYKIECYVPERKRRFGYFSCPVLWKNQLVARVDMKAERKNEVLRVRELHLEPGRGEKAAFREALERALADFARFNGCGRVEEAR
jgi:uncharacterized protein YcaQ